MTDKKTIFYYSTQAEQLSAQYDSIDFVDVHGEWMHLAPAHRERAFRKLSSLLKPNGKLIISLRHGECRDGRVMYSVSSEEHQKLASKFGLSFELASAQVKKDQMGRSDVSWETVVLTLPDGAQAAGLVTEQSGAMSNNKHQ